MRKICVPIIAGFLAFSAFGAGENVPTSKSYIDSVLVDKQDTIERTTGASQALTNTGTAGEYGTKDIYDSTGEYAAQQDALVDAATMNAAVQNAINAEFVCISWVDDDPTKDCLLMEIRGTNVQKSPNLFDVSKITTREWGGTRMVNNGDGSITAIGRPSNSWVEADKLNKFAPELVAGKTYTLSMKSSLTNFSRAEEMTFLNVTDSGGALYWGSGQSITMTDRILNAEMGFQAPTSQEPNIISNIQITEGTTVQPYQPYGNVYIPSGNQ